MVGVLVAVGLWGCKGRTPAVAISPSPTPFSPAAINFQPPKYQSGYTPDTVLDFDTLQIPDASPEVLSRGRTLYIENCAVCHEPEAYIPDSAAPNLDPQPDPLDDPKLYKRGHDLRSIIYNTHYGIEGTGMAPWGHVYDDAYYAGGPPPKGRGAYTDAPVKTAPYTAGPSWGTFDFRSSC